MVVVGGLKRGIPWKGAKAINWVVVCERDGEGQGYDDILVFGGLNLGMIEIGKAMGFAVVLHAIVEGEKRYKKKLFVIVFVLGLGIVVISPM